MLTKLRQIKMALAEITSDVNLLLIERELFIKEFERLNKENEKLKQDVERKTNSKKTT